MIGDFVAVQERFHWFAPTIIGFLGALIGSFLNVVVIRTQKKESVVFPGSHCQCGKHIAWYDNIPILSWFILRGRSRCCNTPFSVRYPLVEAVTCALFIAHWFLLPLALCVCGCIFTSFLIAAALIDFESFELPEFSTIGLAGVGLVLSVIFPSLHAEAPDMLGRIHSLADALVGLFVGSGAVLWFILISERILKREAMGFGDVKLLGAIGVFCGWRGTFLSMFLAGLIGCVWVGSACLWRWASGKESAVAPPAEAVDGGKAPVGLRTMVPFGPMLGVGAITYFLAGEPGLGFSAIWSVALGHG